MTQNYHELCCTLIEEFYGPFHGKLFSELANRGRCSAADLAHSCQSQIKHVKLGLAGLVQSRLVYHHTTAEGASTYQANIQATYNLLRIGRLVEITRAQHGGIAAVVMSEAINLGFATAAELESKVLETLSNVSLHITTTDYDRWQQKTSSGRSEQVQSLIKTLLDTGFLSHVRSAHMQTEFDVRQDAHAHLKRNGLAQPAAGKKGALEVELRIDEEVRRRIDIQKIEYGYVPGESSERKRAIDGAEDQQSNKRLKRNGDVLGNANGSDEKYSRPWKSNDKVVLSVEFDNVVRDIRNGYLAAKAQKSLGQLYSRTLSRALLQVPITKKAGKTSGEISLDLGKLRDDLNHTADANQSNGVNSNGTSKINGANSHHDHDMDKLTYNEVDRALSQLARSKFDFLHTRSSHLGQEWSINKSEVDRFVFEDEILRLMSDRLVHPSPRILRMLIEKGKLDEKTLQEVGLLGAKELRTTLAQLKQLGYIDLQEVPRESQRQPNRTIFLWFHDSDRVRKILLNNMYKALTRLMQRLQLERNKLATTIEKAERSDASGLERQPLPAAENTVFERWQRKERWLLGEMSRLDESIAILRDL